MWKTTSTPDITTATNNIKIIAKREFREQLGGSDHKPVILTLASRSTPVNEHYLPLGTTRKPTGSASGKSLTSTPSRSSSPSTVSTRIPLILTLQSSKQRKNLFREVDGITTSHTGTKRWGDSQGAQWGKRGNGEKPSSTKCEKALPAEGWFRQREREREREKKRLKPSQAGKRKQHPRTWRDTPKLWQVTMSLNGDNSERGRTTLQTTHGAVTGKAGAYVLARVFEASTASASADRVKDVRTQTRAVLQNTASAGFDPCMTECLILR